MSEVIFIGTSDAFGAGGRRQAAALFRTGAGSLLMDCGATTNTGLAELGISRDEIDVILISHFHGDHFGGIPLFLLAAMYEDQRKQPIEIVGPPDIEARVRTLATAMGHSLDDHKTPFSVKFRELHPGPVHHVGPAEITSFKTRHQLEAHPHGYDIQCGNRRVVYSGDTGWFDELPRLAAGADLFICECTYHQTNLDFHLNYNILSERRDQFDCGGMILTHLGKEMANRRGAIDFDTADDGHVVAL